MDKKLIFLLLLFISNTLFGQGQNEIDSLISISQSSANKKERVDAFTQLSKKYIFTDSAKAVDYATSAIQLSKEIVYPQGIADAYNMIGYVMSTKGFYEESENNFMKSLKISDSLDYKMGKMQTYYGLGNLFNAKGEYDKALKNQFLSLDFILEKGDSLNISSGFYGIGTTYYYKQDFDNALVYFEKALEIRKYLDNQKGVSDIYNTLALVASAKQDSSLAKHYFLSAINSAKEFKNLDHLYTSNLNYGNFLWGQWKYNSAIKYYHDALKPLKLIDRPSSLAGLYYAIGSAYHNLNDFDSSLFYINASTTLYSQLDNLQKMANGLDVKSLIFQSKGQLINAINTQQEAIEIYENLNDTKGLTIAMNSLANIYFLQEKFDKSLNEYLKVAVLQKSINNKTGLSLNLGNIANAFLRINQYDSAKKYYENAIQLSEELKIDDNLSHQYVDFGRYFYLVGDNPNARKYFLKGIEKSKKVDDKYILAKGLIYLGQLENKLNNPDRAMVLLYEGLALSEKIEEIEVAIDGWKILAQIEKEQGNYQKAFEAMSAYHSLYDSLNGMQSRNQMNELEVQFETKRKEQEIENLEQKASIQTLQLEQSNLYLTISFIAILSLALIGLVIYLYHRQKRFALEQKAHNIEQTLLRTQMNPHFIFNALTAIQDYNNLGDPKKANLYLIKFSKLMRQVLDNSRSEFISLEQEINMLENYLSLQQLRPDCNFEYTINIDDEIFTEDVAIPPMFAQPFVENAIEHGLVDMASNGKIEINIKMDEDNLHLTVIDNGKGISNSNKVERVGHKSHAMNITQERIDIYKKMTNKNISFQILDNSPGTKVIFNLPYQYI